MREEELIKECFKEAEKGIGLASPNPLVGAIVVKNGEIIGRGYHEKFGGPHAEVNAINGSIGPVSGATLYCNLEPCCHTSKKTPPCADFVIKSGIKKVIISNLDPNPEVSGKGVDKLIKAGVEVESGILKEEGERINKVFFKWIKTKIPYVHLKWAQTFDGFIADSQGNSKWISDQDARAEVHKLRLRYDAIMVGKNTVLVDNPKLNVRLGLDHEKKCPYRTIIGSIENKENYQVFNDEYASKTLEFSEMTIQNILEDLGKRGISSVLVEGGANILRQFIENELWDELSVYISSKTFGSGVSVLDNLVDFSTSLSQKTFRVLNDQRVIEAYRK